MKKTNEDSKMLGCSHKEATNFNYFHDKVDGTPLELLIAKIKLDWWEIINIGWGATVKVRWNQLMYWLGLNKKFESMDEHPEAEWDLDFKDSDEAR